MLGESFGNAVGTKQGNNQQDVAVLASVVVPKDPYRVRNSEAVVEEARKEGICLVFAEGFLTGQGYVVFGKPEEVVVV